VPISFAIRDGILCFETVGDVDFEEGLGVLTAGVATYLGRHAGRPRLAFDLRRSTEDRDPKEIRAIAERLSRELTGARLALIVAKPLYYGLSRMFASYLEPSRFEPRVFEDSTEAFAWLGAES
jgi:hypothetical protein